MLRSMLVFNPEAGFHDPQQLAFQAEKLLLSLGWQVKLSASNSAAHMTELARQAAAMDMDAFFVIGGDGSARCAAAGLVGSNTALGVLPGGTANVWAQQIGLLQSQKVDHVLFQKAVYQLAWGQVFSTDLGECNGELFLLWCGTGLDGLVIHNTELHPHWLKSIANLHFAAVILWQTPGWSGMKMHFNLDGLKFQDHALLVICANASRYLGGMAELSPNVLLDDGRLDMWLFSGSNPPRSFEYVFRLLLNRHHIPPIRHISFQDAELFTDSPLWVHLDGDAVKIVSPLNIRVHPQALRVIVPKETPRQIFRNAPQFTYHSVMD